MFLFAGRKRSEQLYVGECCGRGANMGTMRVLNSWLGDVERATTTEPFLDPECRPIPPAILGHFIFCIALPSGFVSNYSRNSYILFYIVLRMQWVRCRTWSNAPTQTSWKQG